MQRARVLSDLHLATQMQQIGRNLLKYFVFLLLEPQQLRETRVPRWQPCRIPFVIEKVLDNQPLLSTLPSALL